MNSILSLILIISTVLAVAAPAHSKESKNGEQGKTTTVKDSEHELSPTSSMPMWYYGQERQFRYPIPTNFEFAYIDKTGKVCITGPFAIAYDFNNGVSVPSLGSFRLHDGKWSLDVNSQHGTPAILKTDGQVVFTTGTLKTQFYDELAVGEIHVLRGELDPSKPMRGVERSGLLFDKSGHVVFQSKWKETGEYSEGLVAVTSSFPELWGYADKAGTMVIPPQFFRASRFSEGLAAVTTTRANLLSVRRDPKFFHPESYCYVDKAGRIAIKGPFMEAGYFHQGVAAVMLDGKWGYIDKNGKQTVPCEYDWAGDFLSDLAPVEKNKLVGFIDQNGKQVIPFKFKDAREFSDGLAPATLDGRSWGYVDRAGKFVIAAGFQRAFPFHDGRALVYISPRKSIVPLKTDVPLLYASALKLRTTGDFNQARKFGKAILDLDPQGLFATRTKVLLESRLPDHDVSTDLAQKYAKAVVLGDHGQLDESEKLFKQVLAQDPEFHLAAGGLALVLVREKKYDEAIALMKATVKKRPRYARGWWRLSQAYEAKGDQSQAAECLQEAKNLDPDDESIQSTKH